MSKLTKFFIQEFGIAYQLANDISDQYRAVRISKGDYLVKSGQYCKKMCFIEEGYFRFYSHTDRKTITHWIFGEGQLVTDVAGFFLGLKSKWNIQALTDANVFMLTHDKYEWIRANHPYWEKHEKEFLVRLMSALENRVYALLSMNSEERYQYLFQSDPQMFNELPLQYLASMLGMSPETLSRIRSKSTS